MKPENYTAPRPPAGPSTPSGAQKPNRKRRFGWKIPVTAVVAGGLGLAAGAGASNDPASVPAAASEPAPTVTVTETPEPEVITETVTEEVEVEVAPASCADALDAAEDAFDIYSDGLTLGADAVVAAAALDYATINSLTGDIEALLVPLEDALFDYYLSAEGCRS